VSLRVIAGSARGRKLEQPPRDTTRPLTDRAREALFNILTPRLRGARVLDLFAGSGAVGIEALSRSAEQATFVEMDGAAARVIQSNLDHLGFGDDGEVVRGDAVAWIGCGQGPFDLVFSGPPQWQGLWARSLQALDAAAPTLLAADGIVVSQCDPSEAKAEDDLRLTNLEQTDQRTYGKVLLTFHRFGP
jgi:16S rRNA (guanine(966)-N(2))-methyltransferase RsmD